LTRGLVLLVGSAVLYLDTVWVVVVRWCVMILFSFVGVGGGGGGGGDSVVVAAASSSSVVVQSENWCRFKTFVDNKFLRVFNLKLFALPATSKKKFNSFFPKHNTLSVNY